ncbi:MAG: hypothetical protein AB8B71_06320 [Paracoccaceae bacterium]
MTLTYLLAHWGPCRAALSRHFPTYSFPDHAPSRADLQLALTGLAAAYELTPQEMVDTISDHMIFVPAPDIRLAAA